MQEVTVIIPTLALRERREKVYRAVESVLTQEAVDARPLLVVNGQSFDDELVREVRSDARVTVVMRKEPSLPGAIRVGLMMVQAPWFTVLDDDDILLPGALSLRVETLTRHPDLDTVVTNGYQRSPARDQIHIADSAEIKQNPLRALLDVNWLLQGSWLCRTEAFGATLLEGMPQHLECTFLAARFASTGRMLFLETPTVVCYLDTPDSASKSEAYRLGEVGGLRAIRKLPVPGWFRQGIDRKISDAYHNLSDVSLKAGELQEAWRWHLKSLTGRGGLRYLLFTRHLIPAAFRR